MPCVFATVRPPTETLHGVICLRSQALSGSDKHKTLHKFWPCFYSNKLSHELLKFQTAWVWMLLSHNI